MVWARSTEVLEAVFTFKDFNQAWAFMAKVAKLADEMDHHPDWRNLYNKVWIKLSSHDAGGKVTEKDEKLAAAIDKIAN